MTDNWKNLEEEVKLLKNEIKQVLVDIKDRLDSQATVPVAQLSHKEVSASPADSAGAKDIAEGAKAPPLKAPDPVSSGNGNGYSRGNGNGNGNGFGNGNGNGHGNAYNKGNGNGYGNGNGHGYGNGHGNGNGYGNGYGKIGREAAPFNSLDGNFDADLDQKLNQILGVSKPPGYSLTGQPCTDLLTVATLSQWLASGVRKVGRERMLAVIDVYSTLGGFPPALTDILTKLLNSDEGDGHALKEGVSLLIEVDNLVNRSIVKPNEAAILSLFCNGKEAVHR